MLNATPLIYLTRCGGLKILKGLNTTIYVPKAVYDEVVVEGRRRGKPGAELVAQYIREGVMTVRSPRGRIVVSSPSRPPQDLERPLDKGEEEVLALARELNCIAIIDEQVGRSIARLHGVAVHGTVYLLMLAHKTGVITKQEMIGIFKRMVAEGWRIGVEDYPVIMEELDKL